MDLSVSIVNTNNRVLLEQCLESIYRTTRQISFEILVVDNCSNDGSAEMVRAKYPDVQLIQNDHNLGYPASHNRALPRCTGRYILVFNEDMIVQPGAFDHMVAFMDTHPDAGMLGGRLLNPDGSLQPSCWPFPSLRSRFFRALYVDKLLPRSSVAGAYYLGSWGYDSVREVDVVAGCCVLVRREVLDQVGLMDERFFIYFEETDWCYRTKKRGWRIFFTPDAEMIHYGGQTTIRQSAKMATIYSQSLIKYFQKHYGQVGATVIRILAVIETGLRLAYWWLIWLIRRQKRGYAATKLSLYKPVLRWLLLEAGS